MKRELFFAQHENVKSKDCKENKVFITSEKHLIVTSWLETTFQYTKLS